MKDKESIPRYDELISKLRESNISMINPDDSIEKIMDRINNGAHQRFRIREFTMSDIQWSVFKFTRYAVSCAALLLIGLYVLNLIKYPAAGEQLSHEDLSYSAIIDSDELYQSPYSKTSKEGELDNLSEVFDEVNQSEIYSVKGLIYGYSRLNKSYMRRMNNKRFKMKLMEMAINIGKE